MESTPVYEEMKPVLMGSELLEETIYEKMDVPSEVATDPVVQDRVAVNTKVKEEEKEEEERILCAEHLLEVSI